MFILHILKFLTFTPSALCQLFTVVSQKWRQMTVFFKVSYQQEKKMSTCKHFAAACRHFRCTEANKLALAGNIFSMQSQEADGNIAGGKQRSEGHGFGFTFTGLM